MTDAGELYRAHVEALAVLVADLDDDDLVLPVPATPDWTVRDVVAHLVGGPADSRAGRTDGAPGPGWTARHVAERAHLPVADLVAEMLANTDWAAAWCDDVVDPGILWDAATHHADLHEALGRHRLAEHLWAPILDQLGPRALPTELRESGVPAYEQFRALFSRRSQAQVAAWDTALTPEQVADVGVFGPRTDDQPVPG